MGCGDGGRVSTNAHITRLLAMAEEVSAMAEYYKAELECIAWDRNHPLVNAVSVLGGEAAGLKAAAGWLRLVERERLT